LWKSEHELETEKLKDSSIQSIKCLMKAAKVDAKIPNNEKNMSNLLESYHIGTENPKLSMNSLCPPLLQPIRNCKLPSPEKKSNGTIAHKKRTL